MGKVIQMCGGWGGIFTGWCIVRETAWDATRRVREDGWRGLAATGSRTMRRFDEAVGIRRAVAEIWGQGDGGWKGDCQPLALMRLGMMAWRG